MEIDSTYLIKKIMKIIFFHFVTDSNNFSPSLFKEFYMRRRNVFCPTTFNISLNWLGHNTPYRSLNLLCPIGSLEPGFAENGIIGPSDFYLFLFLLFLFPLSSIKSRVVVGYYRTALQLHLLCTHNSSVIEQHLIFVLMIIGDLVNLVVQSSQGTQTIIFFI